jgi:hypothetical protein
LYHSVLEPYDKKSLSEKMLGKIRRPVSHFEEEAIMRMECFSWEEQQKDSWREETRLDGCMKILREFSK